MPMKPSGSFHTQEQGEVLVTMQISYQDLAVCTAKLDRATRLTRELWRGCGCHRGEIWDALTETLQELRVFLAWQSNQASPGKSWPSLGRAAMIRKRHHKRRGDDGNE